jgi:acetyltransferase-like isoleucine patch superfamily enzyme
MAMAVSIHRARLSADAESTRGERDSSRAQDVYVHPLALCESDHVGRETRIWAFAQVMRGAILGEHCNVGGHTFVEGGARIGHRVTIKNHVLVWDGVTIEDDVFVGPAVVFTNDRYPRSPRMPGLAAHYGDKQNWLEPTRVCRGASLGARSVVMCGVTVGAFATVGAGSVVTRDVPAHAIVVGHPGRHVGWACVCGQALDLNLECERCGLDFEKTREGIATTDLRGGHGLSGRKTSS